MVKSAKILKAAGDDELYGTALCSISYTSAASWRHCPKQHPSGCKAHSFTYDNWMAVRTGPLTKRVVEPPPD